MIQTELVITVPVVDDEGYETASMSEVRIILPPGDSLLEQRQYATEILSLNRDMIPGGEIKVSTNHIAIESEETNMMLEINIKEI